jgi:type II secretory pathway pseudopilin PulG
LSLIPKIARMWNATKNKGEQGFLLVELALALVILGIILGPSLIAFRHYQRFQQVQATKKNQETVFRSLAHYLSLHGCLPYPADPEKRGVSQGMASFERWKTNRYVGTVPYRTLGIAESSAKDGYHQWMTYAVDPSLTLRGNLDRSMICEMVFRKQSEIQLQDGTLSSLNKVLEHGCKDKKYDGVAVVLISHGPKKQGAFSTNGRVPLDEHAGLCKRKNCQDVLSFCLAPDPSDAGVNDDSLWWISRGQLMKEAGFSCSDYFFPHWTIPLNP